MKNKPLDSTQQVILVLFALLVLPSLFVFVGIIPALFLLFGVFMMKRNESFSHVETSVTVFKVLVSFAILGLLVCAAYNGYLFQTGEDYERKGYIEILVACLAATIFPIAYLVAVHFLYLVPLREHSEWVEKNGIFSSKPKGLPKDPEVDIIKGEKLKSYSVADELLKWAQLKEAGHITDDEYNDARKKLLQRTT